ncbi:hypothetical protein BDW75DRAFT_242864 [Aspergillus navahoensis]
MSRLDESKQAGRRLPLDYIDAMAAGKPTNTVFTQLTSFDPPVCFDLKHQDLSNIVNRHAGWLAKRLYGKARGVTTAYRSASRAAGDLLSKRTSRIKVLGSSVCGLFGAFITEPEHWTWVHSAEKEMGIKWEPIDGDKDEPEFFGTVIRRNADVEFQHATDIQDVIPPNFKLKPSEILDILYPLGWPDEEKVKLACTKIEAAIRGNIVEESQPLESSRDEDDDEDYIKLSKEARRTIFRTVTRVTDLTAMSEAIKTNLPPGRVLPFQELLDMTNPALWSHEYDKELALETMKNTVWSHLLSVGQALYFSTGKNVTSHPFSTTITNKFTEG